MEVQLWSEVDVEVQTALGAAVDITSVSKTNPAVASAPSHDFEEGDAILLRMRGAPELNFAVVLVGAVTSTTFVLLNIDGTDLGSSVTGTSQEVTFGASAETITEVTPSGGEAGQSLIQTIHVKRGYNLPGPEAPLVLNLGSLWVPTDPALVEFNKAAKKRAIRAVQFRFPDGTRGLFCGYPSASLVPGGSAGGPVTTPVSISVRGGFTAYEG